MSEAGGLAQGVFAGISLNERDGYREPEHFDEAMSV
jgi:hypothetical protein